MTFRLKNSYSYIYRERISVNRPPLPEDFEAIERIEQLPFSMHRLLVVHYLLSSTHSTTHQSGLRKAFCL